MTKYLFVLLVILPFFSHSQNRSGIVHYGEIQSMGMGAPVGPDYNALLVFNMKKSLYITRQDSLEGGHIREQKFYDVAGGNRYSTTVVTNEQGFRYFNDRRERQFYSRDLGFKYVKEPTPKINWKITGETKKIGDHTVTKATTKFRGREYTAWFTTDIPLPYGPWKLQGLPGLILEAYDTYKEIYWYFKTLEYPSEHSYLLKPIDNKEEWISLNEYAKDLFKVWKNAQVGGRMVAESIDAASQNQQKPSMLKSYIEDFGDQQE